MLRACDLARGKPSSNPGAPNYQLHHHRLSSSKSEKMEIIIVPTSENWIKWDNAGWLLQMMWEQSKDRSYYCFGPQSLTINFLFIGKALCLENCVYKNMHKALLMIIRNLTGVQWWWASLRNLSQGKEVFGSSRSLTSRELNCLEVLAAWGVWFWDVDRSGNYKKKEELIGTKEDPIARWERRQKSTSSHWVPPSHSFVHSLSYMTWAPSYITKC